MGEKRSTQGGRHGGGGPGLEARRVSGGEGTKEGVRRDMAPEWRFTGGSFWNTGGVGLIGQTAGDILLVSTVSIPPGYNRHIQDRKFENCWKT